MLEEKLELLLITYNRAPHLERTLAQLLTSPFAGCRLTVLDNCSPDETPTVCATYAPLFRDMRVIRHTKNIGACPNYLRAVEMSGRTYTWIVCDDDRFDFSGSNDVIEAIESEKYDLISVGSPGQQEWERGMVATTGELIEKGARYFTVFTFVPGVIFRTELFDSECIAKGYRNTPNSYPHFEFINKSVAEDFSVYVSKRQIVHRETHDLTLPSSMYAYTVWANSCRTIEDPQLRRKVLYQSAENRWRWFKGMMAAFAVEKSRRPEMVWSEVFDLARSFSADQRLLLLLMSPAFLFPTSGYRLVRRIRTALRGQRGTGAEQAFDPFRL